MSYLLLCSLSFITVWTKEQCLFSEDGVSDLEQDVVREVAQTQVPGKYDLDPEKAEGNM